MCIRDSATNNGSLKPGLTFGQFTRGGETGDFSAGPSAAGRAVVSGARAKDKVLGIGIDAGLG